jgi:Arc/MetJ family transcription regulator
MATFRPTREGLLEKDSQDCYPGIMKTTVDIPEDELKDAMRFTQAKTKREAIVGAIRDFNRRHRMAELLQHAGTCTDLITVEELQAQRRKG